MEFWFSELHTGNVKLSIKIEKQLFSGESEYQRIDVFDSEEFGKFIALDGEIVFSEKDEFIYDEMVTHVPSPPPMISTSFTHGGIVHEGILR